MKHALRVISALTMLVSVSSGAAYAEDTGIDLNMLNGSWEITPDTGNGTRYALVFSLGGAVLAFQYSDGIAYARADVSLARAGERVRVTIRHASSMIVGISDFTQEEDQIFDVAPAGDGFDVWLPDDPVRFGRMARMNCGLDLVWRQRDDTPPDGCLFLEVEGVGFDMLTGDCEYHQEWFDDWETIRRTPDGDLTPAACLITVPASFERGG